MKKRTVKQKAIERAKWSEVFREGFDMGYRMAKREGGQNDNQLDKVDRYNNQKQTWQH